MKIKKLAAPFLVVGALGLASQYCFTPNVSADVNLPISGTNGTCKWELKTNKELVVEPSSGNECTLGDMTASTYGHDDKGPGCRGDVCWLTNEEKEVVETTKIKSTVKTGANAMGIFSGMNNLRVVDFGGLDTIANDTNLSNMFNNVRHTIEELTLGARSKFYINMNYGHTFIRGTWQKVGEEGYISAPQIFRNAENGMAAGTYRKISNISDEIKINKQIKYKINPVSKIDGFETTRSDLFKKVDNKNVQVKVDISEDEYTVPGRVEMRFDDAATDSDGNKYDLKIAIENIKYYNLDSKPEDAGDFKYNRIFHISEDNNIMLYSTFSNEGDVTALPGYNNVSEFMDVTIGIFNKDGTQVDNDGEYLFSIYDLDIAAAIDLDFPDGQECTKEYSNREHFNYNCTRRYNDYSEGVNLGQGFDLNSVKTIENTALIARPSNGYTGTRSDATTEFSEFVVNANAKESKFVWSSGGSAGSVLFAYYQPISVSISKQDESGNNIAGAKLELYYDNEKIKEWTSEATPTNLWLMPGMYTLKEVSAPEGYEKNANEITFFVDIDDRITINNESVESIVLTNKRKIYKVKYVTDEGGEITGDRDEDVPGNDNPKGTSEKAEDGYEFSHWIADVDVILIDGTVIKAGSPITEEQIKKVVVNQDITFTAIYKKSVKVPNTGDSTDSESDVVMTFGAIVPISVVAGLAYYVYNRKKSQIKFN